MTDYTPTTEQVKDLFHLGALDMQRTMPDVDVEATLAMFDRWLVEHDREVRDNAFRVASAIALTYNKGYSQHPDDKPWEEAKSRISEAILTQVEGY